ncbi:MAG TPA: YciI family protein [Vitreimonas sp.]|uniref:YciI family protein n=1 Tax=Vitreimonas sp. TaxID=3069702 RepID=UPI002D45B123|nr:YciI family protein [Vitreimonas sp.]HYD86315.1 YciI family protein [Vitreimonas sp.]
MSEHSFARRLLVLSPVAAVVAACSTLRTALAQTEEGAAVELFIFTFRPGPAWRAGEPMSRQALGSHAAYWRQLVADGRAFAAGGFVESEGGMAIVVAADIAAARAIMAADPAIASDVFVGDIEHWRPRYRTDSPLPRRS